MPRPLVLKNPLPGMFNRYGVEVHPDKGAEGETWITDGLLGPVLILDGTDWTDEQLARAFAGARRTLHAALGGLLELAKTVPVGEMIRELEALGREVSDRGPVPDPLCQPGHLPRAQA